MKNATTEAGPYDQYLTNGTLTDEEFIEQLFLWLQSDAKQDRPRLAFHGTVLNRLRTIEPRNPSLFYEVLARFRLVDIPPYNIVQAIKALPPEKLSGLPRPQTGTEILEMDIPPVLQLSEGLLREGLLLFGGKSKRGKSWLMLDIAMSIALGNSVLRHFPTPTPQKVLYLALEDGITRIKSRLRQIQPALAKIDNMHFLFRFPLLTAEGIERLRQYITEQQYRLVIIDVLARVEPEAKGKQEKGYREVYQMFAPLQELRNSLPFCLAMLTHLRKQEAEDVFENFHGSIGYTGAQDYLWVLERKPKDDYAFLHIQDKDAEDKTLSIRFRDGHWEYIGEGEEYQLDKDRRNILRVLQEEQRELGIPELMKACNVPDARYAYFRQILMHLVKDDMIHRARQGRYSATIRAREEVGFDDDSDVPF